MSFRRSLTNLFTLIALAGLVITTACASGGAANTEPTPTPLPTPAAQAKQTFTVSRGDISAQVQFSARVIPAIQEELFFRTDGRVRKVYVRAGDPVTEGQVLADLLQLDDMETQARHQEMDLRRAEIALEMAWLRQQLAATQVPSYARNYDIEMKMQEYEVELAQLALEETKLNSQNLEGAIEDARIVSPINGKVLNMSVLEGAEVRAFNSLITVGDDSQLEVGATLTSNQMQELAEEMPATMELPNRPGQKLSGKIRSLPYPYGTGGGSQTSQTQSTGGTAVDNTTRVSVDDAAALQGFRLGELVNVTVILESKEDVLWLPPSAIRTFEGRNFVVVQTEGLPKRVDVRLGIKNQERVEILEGLEEGQVVVAP